MLLGLLYDEAARKSWQERARSGEAGFDVNKARARARARHFSAATARRGARRQVASRYCDETRRAAEELYDRAEQSDPPPRCPTTPPRGGAKGGSEGPAAPAAAKEGAGAKRKGWTGNGWERGDGKRARRGGARGGASSAAGGRWASGR